jgi:hypothetical protein
MDDKWFKRQQKIAGVTADDIAREIGRDRSVVSRVYVGRQKMTLELAAAFAKVLQVDVATVLEKAGVAAPQTVVQLRPGFSDSDATPFEGQDRKPKSIAAVLGLDRNGVDVWRMKSQAMCLVGILAGDFLLVDTHAADRVQAGDIVVAQLYNNNAGTATTVIRRFEPPVLVAASSAPDDQRVHIVDGINVVIRGRVAASWRA